jgi:uncharacterized protein YndB with AHSA1/START domain
MSVLPPIETKRLYKTPIENVWEHITDQKKLALWLMPGNFKPEVGHQYHFLCYPAEHACKDKVFGEVLEVNAPNFIKFSWKTDHFKEDTLVSFSLNETTDGVLFEITHEGFSQSDIIEYDKHVPGWEHHLSQLEKLDQDEKTSS